MIELLYQCEVPYPLGRVLSQYFDLEHLDHVHPNSFGRARLISQHHDTVVWELEWPPLLGLFRFCNRVVQRFVPPNHIQASLTQGFLRGATVDIQFHETSQGTCIEERYHLPLPCWSWLKKVLQRMWPRWLDRIWEEDLRVGVCHGGWPGIPRVGGAESSCHQA